MTLGMDDPGGSAFFNRLSQSANRVLGALSGFPPLRWRKFLMLVGAAVFVVGAAVAAANLEVDWSSIRWQWIGVAMFVGVPLTVTANALEYRLSAVLLGHRVPLRVAVQVAVISTAANLLPIPGGALVRVQALRKSGQSYKNAGIVTAVLGIAWLGVGTVIAGLSLLGGGATGIGALMTVGGCLALSLDVALITRYLAPGSRASYYCKVTAVEVASMLTGLLRMYAVLKALGEDPSVAGAAMLSLAVVLASVVGVFPGGLGLRELLATLLGPVGGVAVAAGFLATAMDRILGLAFHAPLAGWVARRTLSDTPNTDSVS